MMERLPVLRAALMVLLIWAGIYLPTLGTLELRGEEGRRILPGQTMLRTGNWVVPEVGGEVYLRKPPMINWLAAGSFALTGVQNEWTARLPSVLGVLALALVTLLAGRRWLGMETAFGAAIFTMTNFGMIDKGRLLEIDALYSVATGLAILLWLRGWMLDRPWWNWLGAGLALAFGCLLKGPPHLLFFYAVMAGVLWAARDGKKWLHPAHFSALLLAGGLVALWLVPYERETAGMGTQMMGQITDRLDGSDFSLGGWLLNIPRGWLNLLPWSLFVPFLWVPLREETPVKTRQLFVGLRLAVVVAFLAVSLAPGSLPRYTMPVTLPFAVLIALWLTWGQVPEMLWETWRRLTGGGVGELKILALRTGGIMVVLMAIYSLAVVPRLKDHTVWRSAGEKINSAVPLDETLYAVDPGSQAIFFYLRGPVQFVGKVRDLPPQARYLLAREKPLAEIRKRFPKGEEILSYPDRGGKVSAVVRVR